MEIIPFGKYKGQPLEAIKHDEQYLDWLSSQDWFREKYANIYQQIIVNNFTEPADTPDHNKMQSKFLNKDYCLKVLIKPEDIKKANVKWHGVEFESKEGSDIVCTFYYDYYDVTYDSGNDEYIRSKKPIRRIFHKVVEIKPFVGDDWPAILRDIKHRKHTYFCAKVLIYSGYSGTGCSESEMIEIFKSSEIQVMKVEL